MTVPLLAGQYWMQAFDANALLQIVEDKTFGLKNKKKSKKVQQYVPCLWTAPSTQP